MRAEPAVIAALVAAIVNIVTLVVFGEELSRELELAIISAVTIIAGFFIRSQVTPVP